MKRLLAESQRWLSPGRIAIVFVLLVGVNSFAPFHADDYFQQLLLRDDPLLERGDDGSLFGLFSFIDNQADNRRQMQRLGVLPWFAAEDFHFRFWRPLAELTHWLDYQLAPENPAFSHWHNIAWFLLVSLLVYALARETLPQDKRLLWLVLAIFLLDGQHVATIHWIANRNALIAAFFSLTAFFCHIRWRRTERLLWLLPAMLMLTLALLASESAVAVLVYLFFYAWLVDGSKKHRAFAALVPYGLIVACWWLVYQKLGFGVGEAGGLYINPLHQPWAYLQASSYRLPVYFASALLPLPAGLSWGGGQWLPWLTPLLVTFSALFTAAVLWFARRLLASDRVLCFWLFGGLFAVLPVATTLAQDRLALMQTVGMDIAIALVIYRLLLQPERWRHIALPFRNHLPAILLIIHLVLSPLHLLAGSVYMTAATISVRDKALAFADNDELEGEALVVMAMPIGEATSLMGIRRFYGYDIPGSFLWLASDETQLNIERIGKRLWRIEKPAGFASGHEAAFGRRHFREGERIAMTAGVIVIEQLDSSGRPVVIRLELHGDAVIRAGQAGQKF